MLVLLIGSQAGCAVHHYHHFDNPNDSATQPRPGEISPASPSRTSNAGGSPTTSYRPALTQGAVVTVALQVPEKPTAPAAPPMKAPPEVIKLPTTLTPENPNAPTPPAVTGVSLDQVINATLLADPKIRSGFETINQASADALTASLKPNPTFSASYTLVPLTRPFTVDRQGGPPQLDAGVAYPIDWFLFGKRAAAMQAAGLGVRVSEADYADLVRQRVLEAAAAYYDLLEAKGLLDLARQDVENLKRVEDVTRKAVENGGKAQVELNRIRLDRLRSEQTVRDAEKARVVALAKLRAVMGRSDADPAFDVAAAPEEPVLYAPLPVEEAFALASRERPDVQSLRWKVAQAQANTASERQKAFPQVTPRVGYTRQYQQKAIGFPDASSFGFGADVTLPIHDRNQGNRLKATSVVAQTNFDLQAGVVALRSEVEQTTQELRTAVENSLAVAREQLKLAEQVRDSVTQAYEVGGRPLIDVLDAQRNYRDTYRLFISSRASYGRAVIRYSAMIGQQVRP